MDSIDVERIIRLSRTVERGLKETLETCCKAYCTVERSLKETLETCCKASRKYGEILLAFPFCIDLLGEALHSESLKETAHCRILYKILQYKDLLKKFIEEFFPDVSCSWETVRMHYPDKDRIDLSIEGDTFFLIIENKINEACEQRKQIDRYVQIARHMYKHPIEEIYVLYLGGEADLTPSEYSMSTKVRQLLGDRLIRKNYKDDIVPWIADVYEATVFDEQPFLKSALLSYKTYLEKQYYLNNRYEEDMNNELDKTISEMLKLDSMSWAEKTKVIEDQISNTDKIRERLCDMLRKCRIGELYDECSGILSCRPTLTMRNDASKSESEFGFNFRYRNTLFRCCVQLVKTDPDLQWGVTGETNRPSCPEVFEALEEIVKNEGFHVDSDNKWWVVVGQDKKEDTVDKFVKLTRLICKTEACTVEE